MAPLLLLFWFVPPEKKKRKTRGDHFKQRFRKNFTTLLEEEVCFISPSFLVTSLPSPDSSLCPLIGRTCRRSRSPTTCQRWPHPPRCPPVTSAVSVVSRPTTPAPPVEGATAAASVCVPTERPGIHTGSPLLHPCGRPAAGLPKAHVL